MKEIKLEDCKVGDYLNVTGNEGEVQWLEIVKRIKHDMVIVDIIGIENLPYGNFIEYRYNEIDKERRIKFFKLNKTETKEVRLKITLSKI